jgi:lysyl-tRNA synthetase class 2
MDTPCLTYFPGFEPNIDSFSVQSVEKKKLVKPKNNQKKGDLFYLISSPEYSLKKIWALSKDDFRLKKIFEISHCFRDEGEVSVLHSSEFLMLEWYNLEETIDDFLSEIEQLIIFLKKRRKKEINGNRKVKKSRTLSSSEDYRNIQLNHHQKYNWSNVKPSFLRISLKECFREKLNLSYKFDEMAEFAEKKYKKIGIKDFEFSDLFFLIFLNEIEPEFEKKNFPFFIYDYPKEISAMAREKNDTAMRYELYWGRVEIANIYIEELRPEKLAQKMADCRRIRRRINKNVLPVDRDAIDLHRNFNSKSFPLEGRRRSLFNPDTYLVEKRGCGAALGLDRLYMLYSGHTNLEGVSPYYY